MPTHRLVSPNGLFQLSEFLDKEFKSVVDEELNLFVSSRNCVVYGVWLTVYFIIISYFTVDFPFVFCSILEDCATVPVNIL